jgi:FtsH-binding integral membrane protein
VAWQQARPTGALLNDNQQRFMTKVFGWMFMGLGLTAMVAYGTFALGFLPVVFGFRWILLIAQLGLVFWLSASLMKMKPATAAGTFLGYSALNGLTLGAIFAIYNPISIALTFAGTASMFGFLFVLGLVVKRDLSTMGRFLIMTVWGLVVMSLINMVAMSFGWLGGEQAQSFHLLISYAGVFIFSGLTVYDAQKLKNLSRQGFANPDDEQRLSVLGALTLYLDFINLFLFLLRILGDRR